MVRALKRRSVLENEGGDRGRTTHSTAQEHSLTSA
jgi:hypothetical protein